MDLTFYRTTPLEDWISSVYKDHNIYSPADIDIHMVASIFGGAVSQTFGQSHVRWEDDFNFFVIFLDKKKSEKEKRLDFFHELCHPLKHIGSQMKIPLEFRRYQEGQANQFQMYAGLPFYMLQDFSDGCTLKKLSDAFNLPEKFIRSRIDQIYRRIAQEKFDLETDEFFRSSRKIACHPYWL